MTSETNVEVKGSCLCGRVEYAVKGPYLDFRYCHCERCRKATGSAFGSNLVVLKEQVRWVAGEKEISLFIHKEAENYPRGFCRHCGGMVPRLARDGKRMIVPAGTLEMDPVERPNKNIFWGMKAPWFVAPHEIEKFEGYP